VDAAYCAVVRALEVDNIKLQEFAVRIDGWLRRCRYVLVVMEGIVSRLTHNYHVPLSWPATAGNISHCRD